jgi:hypothetical protein
VSIFSKQEQIKKERDFVMKMVTFAHYDYVNRLNLITQRPVYGKDLRDAVKISFILDAELFSGPTKS